MSKNFVFRSFQLKNPIYFWGIKVKPSSGFVQKKRDIFSGLFLPFFTFITKPEVYLSNPSINFMP